MSDQENRQYIRASANKIPVELRERVLAAIQYAEETEKWNRIIVDGWARESEKRISEIVFLKAEIKGLVDAIHAATNKKSLCAVADGIMEKIRDREHEEEQKRLAAEFAART